MNTPALQLSRCSVHAEREAAARCMECRGFFCRECITEHVGRMLCTACIRAASAPSGEASKKARSAPVWFAGLGLTLRACVGLLVAWAVFGFFALLTSKIPESLHDGSIWTTIMEEP